MSEYLTEETKVYKEMETILQKIINA